MFKVKIITPRSLHQVILIIPVILIFLLSISPESTGQSVSEINIELLISRFASAPLAYYGKPAVPYLVKVLESTNNNAISNASYALEHMEYPQALEALPALIELLNGDDEELNFKIATAIAAVGKGEGITAAPILQQTLMGGSSGQQYDAAEALGNIGVPASSATPAILEAWDEADDNLKVALAYSLARFDGPNAQLGIDNLVLLAYSEENRGRKAAKFLAGIDLTEDQAIDIFSGIAVDAVKYGARLTAVKSLEVYLPNPVALDAIKKAVDDEEEPIRRQALRSLYYMEPISDVIGIIEAGLDDEHWTVREAAAEVLGQIGEISDDALTTLRLMSEDDEEYEVREAARIALLAIE